MIFHVNHMKHHALFSSKDIGKKKIKVFTAAILLGTLRTNRIDTVNIYYIQTYGWKEAKNYN